MSYDYCDDFGYWEFYEVKDIKAARKQHKCCECGLPIKAGSPYVLMAGKFEGDFCTEKQHTYCAEACRAIRDCEGGCIPYGDLGQWLRDEWHYRKNWKARTRKAITKVLLTKPSWRRKTKEFYEL